MVDLTRLSQPALKAAMEGGTEEWGKRASAFDHKCYVDLAVGNTRRRKCRCGCGKRITHGVYANGIILASGCELSARRLLRQRYSASTPPREKVQE